MTLKIVTLAASFVVGIALATFCEVIIPAWLLILFSVAGFACSAWISVRERRWIEHSRLIILLAASLAGTPAGYWRTMEKLGPPAPGTLREAVRELPAGTAVALRGTIAREPDARSARRGDLTIRVSELKSGEDAAWRPIRSGNILLRLQSSSQATEESVAAFNRLMHPRAYGYRVEVVTRHAEQRRLLNPGQFDMEAFLAQKGVEASYRTGAGKITVLEESRGHFMMELALATKVRFLRTYKTAIRSPASRLAAAATLGVRRAVEDVSYGGKEITEMFRHAGVGHVLAVSGLHVSIISVLLYSLLRLTGLRPRVFAPPLVLFLVLFALLTGARPSSVRAVIMNSVIITAYAYLRLGLRQATSVGLAASSLLILAVNPLLLYAPSFLLSFGAVLSLVIIAPVLDPWLRQLRGFSLLFGIAWFVGLLVMCSVNLDAVRNPLHVLGGIGLLWALVAAGARLNDRSPRMWNLGLEGLPNAVRMFISAQLAIQCGMMVPLSAWFFGRFPVAGVVVNFAAIPAIGVLVQLGMLTGLVGLIPVVGHVLALPLGAATTVAGQFFLLLAHGGATVFPFPATPRPTPAWMAGYYAAMAACLFLLSARTRLQGLMYRMWRMAKPHRPLRVVWAAVPVVLLLIPLSNLLQRENHVKRVACLAVGRHPVLTVHSDRDRAVLVNASDAYTGGTLVFDAVRSQGAGRIDKAIITGTDPSLGNEGLSALALKMHIGECLLPIVPEDPADYLDAIGDDYIRDKAADGESWALRYAEAYTNLLSTLAARDVPVRELGEGTAVQWADASVEVLAEPGKMPSRYVSSARTAVLRMDTRGFTWLVVSDTVPDTLYDILTSSPAPCDVLVLPSIAWRSYYRELLDTAVDFARPRVVIVAGESLPKGFDLQEWAARRNAFVLIATAADGAVVAEFPASGVMRLRTHATGRVVDLMANHERTQRPQGKTE